MHRAINEIMAIIVHSIIVISDHIVIPGLIRQGKVCQRDLAEIVRDQIVEPLPHLVGAAVGHPGAGRSPGVRQLTGARLPSVSIRISLTVY